MLLGKATDTRAQFGFGYSRHVLSSHHDLLTLDAEHRIQPLGRNRRRGFGQQWHHNSSVQTAEKVRLDVQQIAEPTFVFKNAETGHQNRRCRARGKPFVSTNAFALARALAFSFSHFSCLRSLTASAIPASADRETLIPSAFASLRSALSSDRFVGFRVDLAAAYACMVSVIVRNDTHILCAYPLPIKYATEKILLLTQGNPRFS